MTLPVETSPPRSDTLDRLLVATAEGVVGPSGTVELLGGRNVGAVATDGDGLWALVDRRELHRVDSGSAHLVDTIEDGTGVCLHVHGHTLYVGGDRGMLWRLDDDGADRRLRPVASFAEAPSRDQWYTPWGGPPSVYSLADHGEDLYVSVHVGGILTSGDGGRSWRATLDLQDDVHQVAVDADGAVYAATGMRGLAESRDGGRTWRHHTRGLHATYLLAVAVSSQGVLVGASSGPFADDGAVYLFHGEGFAPVEGLPEDLDGAVGPRRMVADGDHAALVAPDGHVWVSDDGGRRWRQGYGPLSSPAQPLLQPSP